MAGSTAKGGSIADIVPIVSHTDHTEHDIMVLADGTGWADLRGLAPKQRAKRVIANRAHPAYRQMLQDYFDRACQARYAKHTPHLLGEARSWHQRFIGTGSIR